MKYGIQMCSFEDVEKQSLKEALKVASELGFTRVEFAGFFGNDAKTVKSWLDEYNLEAFGTHTRIDALEKDKLDETIRFHKEIGCKMINCPTADWKTLESFEHNMEVFRYAAKVLNDNGIEFGYHNHSWEMFLSPYGKVVEEEIYKNTPLDLQIDIFWLCNTRMEPIAYLDAHKDKIKVIHLKDGMFSTELPVGFTNSHVGFKTKSVGEGQVPIKEIVEWAEKNNIEMIIESEGRQPSGREEVLRCINFLNNL